MRKMRQGDFSLLVWSETVIYLKSESTSDHEQISFSKTKKGSKNFQQIAI